ncbi:NAD(P)/FAD-dependent oxidoreductase [Nitrosospira lacus]|uniref:FAD-binding domain-containing protein n=1 Tax=Nitrosospira lacus TaxID=1288494 RepID=A0A1W6SPZ4_9PROT|nr:NAD(P)/FAD-dependent oxidoreductase [Nitrosospira lacus]ARO87866.1 NAD(P)/FAD-dependent oxidoreductase [Nitrosospira lacus]
MERAYDVVVIGAGPAGCAAARTLSRAGLSIGLFDKAVFPRDKTCGDALIPDALHALKKLGLAQRVAQISYSVHGMRLISCDGTEVVIRAHGACMQRLKLDELLLDGAIETGVKFLPGHDFCAVFDENEKLYRVEFNKGGEIVSAHAPWVLLATGAHPAPIKRAGLLLNAECRSFAVRQYVRNEPLAKKFNELIFVFDTTVRGGYGWIFPGPDAVFNIGIGFFGSAHKHTNPRRDYERFIAKLPLAQELMRDGEIVSPLRGAPLRTGLSGTRFADGGLLGIGECVGTTFPLTGEGIGKAMETGILAAEAIIGKCQLGRAAVAQTYKRSMDVLQPKFAVYRKAEFLFNWPYLTNRLVRHTRRNETTRGKVEGLFNETTDPAFLLTLPGWMKILFH